MSGSPALDILRHHDAMLAVNKPTGLAVHAGEGHEEDNLMARVEAWLTANDVPWEGPLGPANRLDRDVSGVVLIGLDGATRAALGTCFQERAVRKVYWAVVLGKTWEKGVINRPLGRGKGAASKARTRYRRMATNGRASLLTVRAETGLSHQIRRHLAGIGHPIFGDARYGQTSGAERWREQSGVDRILLHARQLSLDVGDTHLHLVASPDAGWDNALAELKL